MTPLGLTFSTLDVFTITRFTGNPLAVVHVPASHPLSQATKQAIAAEFNLSETVFLHTPPHDDPDSATEWHVDIFTTDTELPLAGHPLIGTACLLALQRPALARGTLITKAGRVPVTWADGHAAVEIPHAVHVHSRRLPLDEVLRLQPGLTAVAGESERKLELDAAGCPVVSIVKGMTFVLVELPSTEALDLVATTALRLQEAALLDATWRPSFVGMYFYVRERKDSGARRERLHCRMIDGTLEDSATGSAACTLAAWLALIQAGKGESETTKKGAGYAFEIVQGERMGRRSEIYVDVQVGMGKVGERAALESVTLRGTAVAVMKGTL